jgi:DNA-binding GntR family transcriptional regulator
MVAQKMKQVFVADRLRDQVYGVLRDEIRAGILTPGERIVESTIAERLGVSRTPVREAIVQLVRDGLLVEVNRRYMLPRPSLQQARDWTTLRLSLEAVILRRICDEVTAAQIAKLEKAFEQEKKAIAGGDLQKILLANWKFRDTLWSLCNSEILTKPLRLFDDMFQSLRVETARNSPQHKELLGFHQTLIGAIKQRDGDKAEAALVEFLNGPANEIRGDLFAIDAARQVA